MSKPKIVVIGAGSYFFGKQIIHKVASSDVLKNAELALVDIDKKVLNVMYKLAKQVFAGVKKCNAKVSAYTDYKKALKGADFVVLTFSYRNTHFRKLDTEIAMKHGIRMCSSDTIGPGGIFRAMRELPVAVKIAEEMKKMCPDAWLINFINPTAVMGMGLKKFVPEIKSFALCDGNHEPYNTAKFCQMAGLVKEGVWEVSPEMNHKVDIKIGGVNHCTFLTKFKYEGKDMLPNIRKFIVKMAKEERKNPSEKAKPRYNWNYALQLFDLYGAYPTAVSHTKEYVPYYQGTGVADNKPEPIRTFNADTRQKEMDAAWEITKQYSDGKLSLNKFMKNIGNDHAGDIIESMWGNLRKPFFINSNNNGAVTNLNNDAFLELKSDIDMQGVRPHPFGKLPLGILALQQQVLDTHELTAEAAITGDRKTLRLAMLTE
ncbi:MAG: family 4 glycosyl hydrolase [Planctomycetota bacterium]